MKILIANPALGYGGITTYFKELIKCLSLEHNLTVVLADDAVSPINEKGVTVMYHDTQELSIGNALFFINLINNELRPDLVISSQGLIIPIIVPLTIFFTPLPYLLYKYWGKTSMDVIIPDFNDIGFVSRK